MLWDHEVEAVAFTLQQPEALAGIQTFTVVIPGINSGCSGFCRFGSCGVFAKFERELNGQVDKEDVSPEMAHEAPGKSVGRLPLEEAQFPKIPQGMSLASSSQY